MPWGHVKICSSDPSNRIFQGMRIPRKVQEAPVSSQSILKDDHKNTIQFYVKYLWRKFCVLPARFSDRHQEEKKIIHDKIFFPMYQQTFFFFFFLAAPCGLWDLSFPTRDWTQQWKRQVLAAGLSGNCLISKLSYSKSSTYINWFNAFSYPVR